MNGNAKVSKPESVPHATSPAELVVRACELEQLGEVESVSCDVEAVPKNALVEEAYEELIAVVEA